MARINTYPTDDSISGGDKWIGTDAQSNNATKNFTVNKIVSYINNENTIDADTLMFKYQHWEEGIPRKAGSISFAEEQPSSVVSFSSVTEFMLSQSELNSALDLEDYYSEGLAGTYVMLSDINDKNNFGIFQLNSIIRDNDEPEFFNVSVVPLKTSGSLTANDNYFLSLVDVGVGSGDNNFVYTQSTESQTWVVVHGLDKYASVTIVDDQKNIVFAKVQYNSTNQLTINFSKPVRGWAYIN
jgi:hypothetical protein